MLWLCPGGFAIFLLLRSVTENLCSMLFLHFSMYFSSFQQRARSLHFVADTHCDSAPSHVHTHSDNQKLLALGHPTVLMGDVP
jgi:hypothetical protein